MARVLGTILGFCALTLCSAGQSSHVPDQPRALVSNLYAEVVAKHPLGIPDGVDRQTFDPYLSKSLLHRLDMYRACTADWQHKNHDPNVKPPVGLFDNDVFTGGGDQSAPSMFQVLGSQPEKDGMVAVLVKLGTETPPDKPFVWTVKVLVIREDGHYRASDIVYLNEQWSARNTRLSEYLSRGCSGSHWNGQ